MREPHLSEGVLVVSKNHSSYAELMTLNLHPMKLLINRL